MTLNESDGRPVFINKLIKRVFFEFDAKLTAQLFKYAFIGVMTNVFGYLLYLLLTAYWDSPKIVMTFLFYTSVTCSFIFNRKYTFGSSSDFMREAVRYYLTYSIGYILNLAILIVFVDFFGFSHQIVQACAIVCVAVFLFVLMKIFVFKEKIA